MHPFEKYCKEHICMCKCHVKNSYVRHVIPCCKNTYSQYLELDENGNMVFNKHTSIEIFTESKIETVIENINGKPTIIYTTVVMED